MKMNPLKSNRTSAFRISSRFFSALMACFLISGANAADGTWTGGSTENDFWNNSENWSGVTPGVAWNPLAPTWNYDRAIFDRNPTVGNRAVFLEESWQLGQIAFSATGSPNGAYTIDGAEGATIHLAGPQTPGPGVYTMDISQNLGVTNIINVPLVFEAPSATEAGVHNFYIRSNTQFNGAISGGATSETVTLNMGGNSSGRATVNGKISDGDAEGGLALYITGDWTLNGDNDFTGGVTIDGGPREVVIGHDNAFGTGTLTFGAGRIVSSPNRTYANEVVLENSMSFVASSGTKFTGNMTLAEGESRASIYINSGTLRLEGIISETSARGLNITAPGTVVLANANTFTGGVEMTGIGTLTVEHDEALGTGDLTITTSSSFFAKDRTLANRVLLNNDLSMTAASNTVFNSDWIIGGEGESRTLYLHSTTLTINGDISVAEGAPDHLRLTGWSSTLNLMGDNALSGGITAMRSGWLGIGSENAIGTGKLIIDQNPHNSNFGLYNPTESALRVATNNEMEWNNHLDVGRTGYTSELHMGTGAVTLGQTVSLNVITGMVFGVGGAISDGEETYGIIKLGNGTLVLEGNNTFDGDMNLAGGTLVINNAGALGNGQLLINSTSAKLDNTSGSAITNARATDQVWNYNFEFIGTNDLNLGTGAVSLGTVAGATRTVTVSAGVLTIGGAVSDGTNETTPTKNLAKTGIGELVLAGANTLTGNITLSQGTLTLANSNNAVNEVVFSNGTLNLNHADALGSSLLTISNNNNIRTIDNTSGAAVTLSHNGAQTWNRGFIFQGTNDLNMGTGSISLDGATAGTRTVTVVQNNLTIEGIISGSSTRHIQKDGAGTLIFAQDEFAPNTYAGQTRISEGVLRLAGYGALPGGIGSTGGTNSLILDGGVIEMTAESGDFERGIGTGVTQVQITASGGGFSAYDTDIAVNLGGSGATVTWGATGFADTAKLMLSSSVAQATVDFQNGINLKNTAGTATREIEVANGAVAIDAKISGVLSDNLGTGGLNKTGTGTLQLTGVNTYRGQTIITAGTLIVDGSIAESSGITIEEGAFLSGHGTVSQLSGSGTISPGNSPGILTAGSVDGSGGLDFTFEFTLAPVDGVSLPDFGNATASGNDVLRLTDGMPFVFALNGTNQITVDFGLGTNPGLGDVFIGGFYSDSANFFASISGAQFVYLGLDEGLSVVVSTIQQTANFGSGDVNGYVTQFAVIPEPGSVWLLLGGLLGWGCLMIFRRKGGGTFLSPN